MQKRYNSLEGLMTREISSGHNLNLGGSVGRRFHRSAVNLAASSSWRERSNRTFPSPTPGVPLSRRIPLASYSADQYPFAAP